MKHIVIVGMLVAAAGCKKKSEPVARSVPMGSEGSRCDYGCNDGLQCAPKSRVCVKLDHPEIVAVREAEAAAEKAFLAQAGVPTPTTAEQPAPPPAAPAEATQPPPAGAVRVVKIANEGKGTWVIAACTAEERLIGGSCVLDENYITSLAGYPSDHSASDTVGARWNCGKKGTGGDMRIIAYALCQRVTASTSP